MKQWFKKLFGNNQIVRLSMRVSDLEHDLALVMQQRNNAQQGEKLWQEKYVGLVEQFKAQYEQAQASFQEFMKQIEE